MKREELLARDIENDLQDDGYFKNIVPAWLGQDDESFTIADTAPEMPRALQVIDFDLGLADHETDWYINNSNDGAPLTRDDLGRETRKNPNTPAEDKKNAGIQLFAHLGKPYNHDANSLEESCGITERSYRGFCQAFESIVGTAREQEPKKRSREIEAFEKLMMSYPRELAFYITELISDLGEYEYLRDILRRLLYRPRKKETKKQELANIDCAGSA